MSGPYETEAEAFAAAEPMRERLRLAYNYPGPMTEETRAARHAVKVRHVADALEAAGVGLGAHDGHLVRWIARTWDPETIVVLLDWIERAYAAGQDALREEISDLNARIAKLEAEPGQVPPLSVGIEACGRCGTPFDQDDTAFDGRARYAGTLFCRGCVDQCHEADAYHRCIICIGGAR
jgi:hypothetical protein